MLEHQERILSVKDAIKPGYLSIWTKPFTKEMISEYFDSVRIKIIEIDQKQLKDLALKMLIAVYNNIIEVSEKLGVYIDLSTKYMMLGL